MPGRNYTKIFSIIGLFLGEIYMFFTVLAPRRRGIPIEISVPMPHEVLPADVSTPVWARVLELSLSSVYFGLFGALVGLGIGLLITGILQKRRPPAP